MGHSICYSEVVVEFKSACNDGSSLHAASESSGELVLSLPVVVPLVNLGPVELERDRELSCFLDRPSGVLLVLVFQDSVLLICQSVSPDLAHWLGASWFLYAARIRAARLFFLSSNVDLGRVVTDLGDTIPGGRARGG
jgi:hypothetical protein